MNKEYPAIKWELVPNKIYLTKHRFEKYAVNDTFRNCLNIMGYFEYESLPSYRDDEFNYRCRFNSYKDAIEAFEIWFEKQEKKK